MKKIILDKKYLIHYKKRIKNDFLAREATRDAVNAFTSNPLDPVIKDHPLKGKMQGLRSFYISEDLRIIYVEKPDCYIFLDIGSHDDVYYI